jgi:HSP20 family protein
MDIYETEAAYVIEADLPGMTAQDITIQLEDTTIMIAGERKNARTATSDMYAHAERAFGPFRRTLTLPSAVQRDEAQATYTDGVLTVTVPKSDSARPRQITVQAA